MTCLQRYVVLPLKFRTMCLVCKEKAKAIDKVETQENAATAIQALARRALRLSFMASYLMICVDVEVVVPLAKAPAWRRAGLRMDEVSALKKPVTLFSIATGSFGKCSQAWFHEAELAPSKLCRDPHQVRGHAVRC